jgi:hypothetical protein
VKVDPVKSGIRFIAIASGPIDRRKSLMVGVIGRDGVIEGVLSDRIETDGNDATGRIIRMVRKSRFREQVRIVAMNGIALAGLNVVDIPKLEKALGVKAVVLTRGMPRPMKLIRALKEFQRITKTDVKERIGLVREQAKIRPIMVGGFHLQSTVEEGEIKRVAGTAYEMLRIAHLIARGVETGESKGRI